MHIAQRRLAWYKRCKRRAAPLNLSQPHRRYLEGVGAFLELPKSTTDALLPIFIALLNDLIPIIDGTSVLCDYSNGQSSIFLTRAICLVTCKVKQARPFLYVADDGPLLTPPEFGSKLLSGLDAAMRADLEPDRLSKVQILTMMHLHNDGIDGPGRSSSYLSQAIHEAWSLLLHWDIPGNENQEQCDFLWWSLRNFDRLNKPIMGTTPFIIDDTDIAIKRILPRKDSYRSQLMSLSMALGDLMATATKVYKATSAATSDDCRDFPSLEDITSTIDFSRLHKSHKAYLEIWYHVAAMLSCRYNGPNTVQYQRRLRSADRILHLVSKVGDCLPPLPLVPYAMSMSTTTIYRALRDNQRDPDAAHQDLCACYSALLALSQQWTSAKGVARLTKDLLRDFNRLRPMTKRPDHDVENTQQRSMQKADAALAAHTCSPGERQCVMEGEDIGPTPVSMPHSSGSSDHHLSTEQPPPVDQDLLMPSWPAADACQSQLDTITIDGLDNYDMPNGIRDFWTWDFLSFPHEQTP